MFVPPADKIVVLRPPGAAHSRARVAEDRRAPQLPSRRRHRVPVGPILLLGFVGLIVVGSVLPTRDAPRLGPPPARAGTTTVPAHPSLPAVGPPSAEPRSPDRDPAPPVKITRRRPIVGTTPARRAARQAAATGPSHAARPIGPTFYVFMNGKGFVHVNGPGNSIVELRVDVPCAGMVVVRGVAVRANGRFRARRAAGLRGRLPLSVQGTVSADETVRGLIRVSGGRCRGATLRFVARLS